MPLLEIRPISGYWEWRAEHLGRSLGAYTPTPSTPCSMAALVSPPAKASRENGRLFFRGVSRLDAFSGYPLRRSCPACLSTTGAPEAAEARSFRTCASFRSDGQHPQ